MSLTGQGTFGQEIDSTIASIANIWLGCLFVATMFQISLSLQRIDNPNTNLVRSKRVKLSVYYLAVLFSIMFTVGAIVFMSIYRDNELKMNLYMYIWMIIAYSLLPIAYVLTLCKLYNSMKGLPDKIAI